MKYHIPNKNSPKALKAGRNKPLPLSLMSLRKCDLCDNQATIVIFHQFYYCTKHSDEQRKEMFK